MKTPRYPGSAPVSAPRTNAEELVQLRRVACAAALSLYSDGLDCTSQGILEEGIKAAVEDMDLICAAWRDDATSDSPWLDGGERVVRITNRFKNRLTLAIELAKLKPFALESSHDENNESEAVQ